MGSELFRSNGATLQRGLALPWLCSSALLLAFCSLVLSPCLRAARNETWVEVRSPNFTVIGNAGEKETRKIAGQFEQIREVFQNAFPKMRVDLGKPVIILAVKNEDSMKELLPAFWEVKGHVHPLGWYQPAEEKHFVVVRTDTEGENPYEVAYHEYTHALMNINIRDMPLWLSEGVAEFFGNSVIHDSYVEIGKIAPYHLQILQQNRLIPMLVLFQAGHSSPYYNENNRASVFYAESWAIVHYLQLDPESRKRNLLHDFLVASQASGNYVDAAQKTFGDLNKFAQKMEAYSRQTAFYVARVKTTIHGDPKSYSSRVLPPAEVDAQKGELYVYTQRPKEAKASLDAAVEADPNLPLAHEGLGMLAYYEKDLGTAEAEFAKAVQLNSRNFVAYFFSARAKLREGGINGETGSAVVGDLEKTISLNPQFAPAYATLATFYSMNPETQEKALTTGLKAIQLEPGNLNYAVSYGFALLNMGKTADAKVLASRIEAAARTPMDRVLAQQFSQAVSMREAYGDRPVRVMQVERNSPREEPSEKTVEAPDNSADEPPAKVETPPISTPPAPTHSRPSDGMSSLTYDLKGKISAVNCATGVPGTLTLNVQTVPMKFHYSDFSKVEISSGASSRGGGPSTVPTCTSLKGRQARVTFHPAPDTEYDGELISVQVF
jgi:Tfp pilus assembly protein PilF